MRQADTDCATIPPFLPFPDLGTDIGEIVLFDVDSREGPEQRTQAGSPVLSTGGCTRDPVAPSQV